MLSAGLFSNIDILTSTYVSENRKNNSIGTAGLYAASTFLCIPESFQQLDSEALGACWGKEKAEELMTQVGFKVEAIKRMDRGHGKASAVMTCKKS